MKRVPARGLFLALILLLIVGITGHAGPADNADIADLAKAIEAGNKKAIAAKVAAFHKKGKDLLDIMEAFKPRNKGGIGYTNDPAMGLEKRLVALDKPRADTTTAFQKEAGDLTKLAYISLAIAELSKAHAPAKPVNGKGRAVWMKYIDEQDAAAKDLLKAIKAKDAKAAGAAFKGLNGACVRCHNDFRQ